MNLIHKINTRFIYNEQDKEFKSKISYKVFSSVIIGFNKSITTEVLNGHKFRITGVLGDILIVGKYKKGKNKKNFDTNWAETNKKKEQLIAEGKLLYTEWKDENGVVHNNGGEKYMIFYTDLIKYSWKWNKSGSAKFTKNLRKYRFIPTRHNKRELAKRVQDNAFAELTYDIYK